MKKIVLVFVFMYIFLLLACTGCTNEIDGDKKEFPSFSPIEVTDSTHFLFR